jgi:D-alanyl-D-alanine endopeptidase (penicillin-binding protein 7)
MTSLKLLGLAAGLSLALVSTLAGAVSVKAPSWAVVDEQGKLVGGSMHSVARPIASITKLMMAMAYLDGRPDLAQKETISELDIDTLKMSSSRLPVGAVLTRLDMLGLALSSSENRAASALGRSYPGGMPAMVDAMNAKAKALGLRQARFVDATGLSPENVASARDVALMALAAKAYPLIREAAKRSEYGQEVELPGEAPLSLEYKNTNKMLREGKVDAIVSKTGYIKEAGKCLAWAIPGTRGILGLSVLGAKSFPSRDSDELALSEWARSLPPEKTKTKAKTGVNRNG